MNYKAESLNRLDFPLKFGDRPCRIYGDRLRRISSASDDRTSMNCSSMDNEISAIAQGSAPFVFVCRCSCEKLER